MLYRQTKVKRIHYHQTSFTTNVKGTYIVKKYKKRKGSTKSNPNNLENGNRNMYINNYFKCKWIKCSNQKTDWLNAYKNKTHILVLSIRKPIKT